MKKVRLGIFSITSCDGCQVTFVNLDEDLLKLAKLCDIVDFELVKEKSSDEKLDIALIEGGVVRKDEIEIIKNIRKRAKTVIAYGTCATYGGVASLRDFEEDRFEKKVKEKSFENELEVYGIGKYIDVDFYIRGCPPVKEEILWVLKEFLLGKKPIPNDNPVCVECRENENICLLQLGQKCIGPLSYGGCDAVCPTNGKHCYGCRGPIDDGNTEAFIKAMEKHKITKEEIRKIFILFAGTSKKYKEDNHEKDNKD